MMSRVLSRALSALAVAVASLSLPIVLATPAWAVFSQCPAIGLDTGCAVLITVNADGSVTFSDDSTQGPYDGADDTLVGVQNNSSSPLVQLNLSSWQPIFGLESDGLCAASGAPAGCPFGPTGYEGPGTSFTDINGAKTSGTVVFGPGTCAGGVPAGGSAYFSLEDVVDATGLTSGPRAYGEAAALTSPAVSDTGYVGFTAHVSAATVPPNALANGRALDARVDIVDFASLAISTATARTAQATVTSPLVKIIADDVVATSTSEVSEGGCPPTVTRSSSGNVHIGSLAISRIGPLIPIIVDVDAPAPNTTITVPGGAATIVLDEETAVPGGLAVCAIHVYLPHGVDTCVSLAETDTLGTWSPPSGLGVPTGVMVHVG